MINNISLEDLVKELNVKLDKFLVKHVDSSVVLYIYDRYVKQLKGYSTDMKIKASYYIAAQLSNASIVRARDIDMKQHYYISSIYRLILRKIEEEEIKDDKLQSGKNKSLPDILLQVSIKYINKYYANRFSESEKEKIIKTLTDIYNDKNFLYTKEPNVTLVTILYHVTKYIVKDRAYTQKELARDFNTTDVTIRINTDLEEFVNKKVGVINTSSL